MRLCFCSIAFRDQPIEDLLPRLGDLGYDAVEVWGRHLDGRSDDALRALRAAVEREGLGVEVISPYLWLTQTPALLTESLGIAERTIHQARLLGAPKIRTFTDSGPTGIGSAAATPAQRATAVSALRRITAMAPDLRFVVETHEKTLADSVDSTLRLLDEVGAPNLKVLYQPTSAATLLEDYERLRPHVEHLHAQNQTADGAHTWLEDGVMDWRGLLRRLRADGYAGSLSVEYCWKGATWERAASAIAYLRECGVEKGRQA